MMSSLKLLKCEKCGKPLGYISLKPISSLERRPDLDNVTVSGTCVDCQRGTGFYQRSFNLSPFQITE